MTNKLSFWTLQHLYVILSLANSREIIEILEIDYVFSILHPEVEKMEDTQNNLRDRVQPLLQLRKKLAESHRDRASEKKNAADIIDSQEKNDKALQSLDVELQEIQNSVPKFEWDEVSIKTIQSVVPSIFSLHGTQHEQLNGYRRIKATADIIRFFKISAVRL